MTINEGKIDRIFRITLGLGLISLTQWGPQSNLGYLGLIPLLTGMVGFCPLYQVFGFTSCPMKKR